MTTTTTYNCKPTTATTTDMITTITSVPQLFLIVIQLDKLQDFTHQFEFWLWPSNVQILIKYRLKNKKKTVVYKISRWGGGNLSLAHC